MKSKAMPVNPSKLHRNVSGTASTLIALDCRDSDVGHEAVRRIDLVRDVLNRYVDFFQLS